MRTILLTIITMFFCGCAAQEKVEGDKMTNPKVTIKTSQGNIKVVLHEDKVPETVKNFLGYIQDKHYNNTIFHRVIDNFMIQGGGYGVDFKEKGKLKSPIKNEAGEGVANKRGTIAMARTSDPHSATAQFFINVKDNAFLNYQSATPSGYGYCVFGEVIEGMDVVDKIKGVATGNKGGHQDVPVTPITILEITRDE